MRYKLHKQLFYCKFIINSTKFVAFLMGKVILFLTL